jgi:hypothetical protein
MKNFIRKMNTVAIHHITMIGEDMEYTQYIENLAFDLIYWAKCLDWSNLGESEILNQFDEKQIEALVELSKKDKNVIVDFIEDMFEWEKWEKEEPFVVETHEITRNIARFLEYREGLQ